MIDTILHYVAMWLGLSDINGSWYAWWSGIGSDLAEFAILIGAIRAIRKLRHQRDRHHTELMSAIKEQADG